MRRGLPGVAPATHADAVCATDVSERALSYGRLNAALNGVGQVQFMVSDRFAGLRRQKFDLITGNLPFVISPETRFTFRDAGLRSDGFLSSVVKATGSHLVDGGLAQYLAQWAHGKDRDEEARLARWVHAAGCDALIIRRPLARRTGTTAVDRRARAPDGSLDGLLRSHGHPRDQHRAVLPAAAVARAPPVRDRAVLSRRSS